jgi:hypothetical protein
MAKKKQTIVERKLGKHKAVGLAWDDGVIEIDPRQSSKEYFLTVIHEKAHLMFPDWTEKQVVKFEKEFGNFLWEHNFRIVKQ